MTDPNGRPLNAGDLVYVHDELGCRVYGTLRYNKGLPRKQCSYWHIEYEDGDYVVLDFSDVFKAE